MGKIKLTTKEFRYILLLKEVAGVLAKDCLVKDDKVIYVVREGKAGLAIGKGGNKVKRIQDKINKSVEVIEYSSDPIKFLKNIFKPAKIEDIKLKERPEGKVVEMSPKTDRALVRSKLKKAERFAKKYFGIEDILIR